MIIDTEGLGALSIRRLADEIGVNGASLYHHFANKDEILVGAAELALAKVRTPDTTTENWRVWLPRNTRLLREAVIAHPELVPVILRKGSLGMGAQMLESSAARLIEEGVPLEAVMPLLDASEQFAISSAIYQAYGGGEQTKPVQPGEHVALRQAAEQRLLSPEELFALVSERIITAVEAAVAAKLATATLPEQPADTRRDDLPHP
jgi:AcrR family transcriptional regulator